ncbi:glycosyltransferase WbsX family protein [Butyrivibrio sp. WCD2001]|uniref:glycosyltransferase WbsX family protein n=1 Tax=Butyrivibrio sp. WCD2001 TaxID=1280681 RepID=UPI0003F6BA69|nr:glycoside hydrolase family 99-like domain-containing protein [Butyrivibrio sp. WCD2001]
MKVIAFYLPQFHDIPENDEWWGKGFTEWVNVKKAKPLYEGHEQPRVPLNDNYYNLLDDDVKVWQAKIAKEHGIYGFCYYHYWFNGKKLLEKPMEQMLANKNVDLPFCVCWANEPWTKAWVGKKEVLLPQHYGDEKEWKEHFDYLLPFFKDERYILSDGKPLMVIYRAEVIPRMNDMLDYWDALAKENGLNGMTYAYQDVAFDFIEDKDDSRFTYNIEFQPAYSWMDMVDKSKIKGSKVWKKMRSAKRNLYVSIEHLTGFDVERKLKKSNVKEVAKVDFDEAWQTILDRQPNSEKNVPGAFVGWDNTPRKGANGKVYVGDTPEKLKKYMTQQIRNAKEKYNKDMIFMYAWNEWAEGGYLEPDTRNGYGNLEAIRDALKANDEFPW